MNTLLCLVSSLNGPFFRFWASCARDWAVVLGLRHRLSHTHSYTPANSSNRDELAAYGIWDGIRAAQSSEGDALVMTKIQTGDVYD